jgi:cytoskeleton protein RodZ
LPSFGEKLKQEREKRKITLEQISVSTKIGTRMLQALEEDKFNQLPGGIFNKGFVRAYSRFVGLDEDQTVADYLQASGDAPPNRVETGVDENAALENDNEERVSLEASGDSAPRQLPWGLFAAVLLVVALALSLWSYRQRERARQSVRPTPTPAATEVSGASSGVPSKDTTKETTNDKNKDSQTALPVSRPTLSATPSSAAAKPPQSISAQTPAPHNPASAPAAIPGEFTIVIQAREESWISITTDGEIITSELLTAGSERSIHARKEVVVKAGNAGGIDFLFNGKKLDNVGAFGEVKTVTFGPRGMLPNAAAPPPTP